MEDECLFEGVKTGIFNTANITLCTSLRSKDLSVKHEKYSKFIRLTYKQSLDSEKVDTLMNYLKSKRINYTKIDWAKDYIGALYADIRKENIREVVGKINVSVSIPRF